MTLLREVFIWSFFTKTKQDQAQALPSDILTALLALLTLLTLLTLFTLFTLLTWLLATRVFPTSVRQNTVKKIFYPPFHLYRF